MKRERSEKTIEEVLERSLPSVSKEQMESVRERILNYVQSDEAVEREDLVEEAGFCPTHGFGWRRFAVLTTVAALLLAMIWIGAAWQSRGVYAVLKTPQGSLYRVAEGETTPVEAGERIPAHEVVRSSEDRGAILGLADGSRVEMRSQTQLWLERADDGVRILLHHGGVIVNAARQRDGHLHVQTKDMTVSVVGTVFLVNTEEEGSRVAVIEGEVRVLQQGVVEKKLRPGEQLMSKPLMEWQPVSEEVSWSTRKEMHLALLQQSTTAPGATLDAEPREAFEVVSVRPSPVGAARGGRGLGGGPRRRNNRPADNPCGGPTEPVIDPRRFDAENVTAVQLTAWAYGMECSGFEGSYFIFGGPKWFREGGFDVQATRPEGPSDYTTRTGSGGFSRHTPGPKLQRMLQTLLADRFKLAMHREMREMPAYVLTVASGGPKYTASRPPRPEEIAGRAGFRIAGAGAVDPEFSIWKEGDNPCCDSGGAVQIDGRKQPLSYVTQLLAHFSGRPVLDRTGLTGEYNLFFNFAPIENPDSRMPPFRPSPEGPPPTQSIFSVLAQVGLELKASREKVEVWVIDHVEEPSEN